MAEANEDKLREATARGERVQRILEDEDFKSCLRELQDGLVEVMKHGKSPDEREQARLLYLSSEMLAGKMLGVVNRGKEAKNRIEQIIKNAAANLVEPVRRFATR